MSEITKEQFDQEMNTGVFITVEAVDKRVSSKVLTKLETALQYEFSDKKFLVVDPLTCTDLAVSCTECLKEEMYGTSRLLIAATMISEAVNLIRASLLDGYNVITTSYISDMIIELSEIYSPQAIGAVLADADLIIPKNTEIVLMTPVPNNDTYINRLQKFHLFITAAIEDNSNPEVLTKSYRVDTNLREADIAVAKIISIIQDTLNESERVKELAAQMFGAEQAKEEEKPAEPVKRKNTRKKTK